MKLVTKVVSIMEGQIGGVNYSGRGIAGIIDESPDPTIRSVTILNGAILRVSTISDMEGNMEVSTITSFTTGSGVIQ